MLITLAALLTTTLVVGDDLVMAAPHFNKGVYRSAETRAKLAAANLGKRHSDETKAKMSAAHMGRPKSPEARANMSAARMGKSPSTETCAKMSASATARAARPGERERLIEIGRAHAKTGFFRGHKHSPVAKQKMREARLGKPCRHKHRVVYRGVSFRSSWEVRAATAFDRLGLSWEYEPQRFHLGTETYLPDFYVPETGAYWEIKGWMRDIDIRKIGGFRFLYPDVHLVVILEAGLLALEQAAAAHQPAVQINKEGSLWQLVPGQSTTSFNVGAQSRNALLRTGSD